MKLNTSNSKLRSTILFPTKEAQTFYKLASADLAEANGLTPSALVLELCTDALASTAEGQRYSQILYAEDASCMDVFEALFEDWAAIQPKINKRPVVEALFRYSTSHGLRFSNTHERVHHLLANWRAIVDIIDCEAKRSEKSLEPNPKLWSLARNGKFLQQDLEGKAANLVTSSYVSYILEAWLYTEEESDAYRILMDLACMSAHGNTLTRETSTDRIHLLGLIDDVYRQDK